MGFGAPAAAPAVSFGAPSAVPSAGFTGAFRRAILWDEGDEIRVIGLGGQEGMEGMKQLE